MISVESLVEVISFMDIDGDILSLDVEKDKEGHPVKITILSTYFTSPTEENKLEVKITELGYTKKWIN
jgi:hypothetical protein